MNTKKAKYGIKELEKDFGKLTFAKALLTYRLCEEMTQVEMAKKLKISKQALCDLEKGRRVPSLGRAAKIARKLGMFRESFVQLVIVDQLRKENLNYDVEITPRSNSEKAS